MVSVKYLTLTFIFNISIYNYEYQESNSLQANIL